MEYRILGRSGLKVSAITLGTMTFGGAGKFASVGNVDVPLGRTIVDYCIEQGVNLIDTANIYSAGLSEEIIGEILNGRRPGNVLIASKARMPLGTGAPNDEGFSRYHIIQECEKSLKRLRTDVIDIYYMHQWDGLTPLDEMLEALDTLVKQGKIRYIGCSNFSGWHTMKALHTSTAHNYQRFVTQQIHYSLEAREAEYELLPVGIDQGLGALIWSPLAGGLLSGKYTREMQTRNEGRFAAGWTEPPIRDFDRLWNIVDVLKAIAAEKQVTPAQVALAWVLGRASVTSLVIGARNLDQVKDNIKAASVTLTEKERDRLNEVSRLPMLYPYWHQAALAKNRLSPADKILLDEHIG
ncbi:aldo/keto reductase [Niastella koreensis]|uniref:Aldo/keto reductase n=2 Tax=Niastella koreensis TaxID=354356 RepID=G8TAP0_NIAKG|nr:aldo/keto reductase [Niastella koreensis]AEV99220.1 aldo/keto reductase [Niastella koreensis GR20-10]OQP46175.1 aldo/keto reductase [Niastella koreensis]